MTILALDSAGKTAGVALWRDNTLLYEAYLATGHTHSETLLQLCANACDITGVSPAQIDAYAVNIGPGSFTGLRIGLAAVKGLAFANSTPCVPVSTLEALAHTVCTDGLIACALDARRGEVYCALFEHKEGKITRLSADSAMRADAFCAQVLSHALPCVCLGDGAHLVHAAAAENPLMQLYPDAYRLGRASGICRVAVPYVLAGDTVAAAQLSPAYHRLSQAERERALRLQKGDGSI